ncbi:MAG: GNAT family N-acetyltransferase [Granulosicoccus sp.]|nr:GNAT family N-acetyltransferase [Granulosicoccus sp.]
MRSSNSTLRPMEIFESPALPLIIELLADADLPTQDIQSSLDVHFYGLGDRESPDGIIGLEVHGSIGLLRSLVVRKDIQSKGLGKRLVQHIEHKAHDFGLSSLYLLTETAESFFDRLEYVKCSRDAVPASIRSTTQFSSICPDTASVMMKTISLASATAQH